MTPPRERHLPLHTGVGALVVALGLIAGSGPLLDNSFLTHLATGRIIWDGGGFPRTDPYTFTAAGEPWVVQSWLASVLYGALDRLVGLEALRMLTCLLGGILAGLAWLLSAAASSLTGRVLALAPVLLVGLDGWVERPLLFGLAGMALLMLAAEGRLAPAWLVPITWVWANTHGSWPLGGAALVLMIAGRRLDRASMATELRVLRMFLLGLVVSIANPYGVRILTFPVEMLSHREALQGIKEWRPPTFERTKEQAFILVVLVALLALRRAPSWRSGLLVVSFTAASLVSARNMLPACFVLLPVAAAGLAGFGSITFDERRRVATGMVVASAVLGGGVLLSVMVGDPLGDEPYPVEAEAWLVANGLSPAQHRVIGREYVGNWFEFRYGPTGSVFIDDRAEITPVRTVRDQRTLLDAEPDWEAVLERNGGEALLWEADSDLVPLVEADDDWVIRYSDENWIVAVPAGSQG